MGCAQSRIEKEEAVSRYKERRQLMKEAVASRNAFAASHSAYVVAIKNTGAALSDFGQGEAPEGAATIARPGNPAENLLPPPPPLPDFSPSPLQRSISMPDLPKKFHSKSPVDDAILEEQDDDDVDKDVNVGARVGDRVAPAIAAPVQSSPVASPPPPPPSRAQAVPSPPPPPMPEAGGMGTWDYFFAMDENISMPGPSRFSNCLKLVIMFLTNVVDMHE